MRLLLALCALSSLGCTWIDDGAGGLKIDQAYHWSRVTPVVCGVTKKQFSSPLDVGSENVPLMCYMLSYVPETGSRNTHLIFSSQADAQAQGCKIEGLQ